MKHKSMSACCMLHLSGFGFRCRAGVGRTGQNFIVSMCYSGCVSASKDELARSAHSLTSPRVDVSCQMALSVCWIIVVWVSSANTPSTERNASIASSTLRLNHYYLFLLLLSLSAEHCYDCRFIHSLIHSIF